MTIGKKRLTVRMQLLSVLIVFLISILAVPPVSLAKEKKAKTPATKEKMTDESPGKDKESLVSKETMTPGPGAVSTDSEAALRFADDGKGVIVDRNTGLMWVQDAYVGKSPIPLQLAKQYILDMNSGTRPNFGFTNWRLPSINDLETLIDKVQFYPALPLRHPFQNVQNNFYWSSTKGNDILDYVWTLDMATGNKTIDYISYCKFNFFWPVRSSGKGQGKRSGIAMASGLNQYGQLGDGTTEERATLQQVKGLGDVFKISAGTAHAMSISTEGTVWVWGDNSDGQLGNGSTISSPVPIIVKDLWNIVDIAAGENHSLALKSDGTVWAWGQNSYGQLGTGLATSSQVPIQVKGLTGITRIAAGAQHSVALKSDGTVWTWGRNSNGQLGDDFTVNKSTPVQVKNLAKIIEISANMNHTLALSSSGTVWSWGRNSYGLLGDGTREDKHTPVQVRNLEKITAISAGLDHSMALKADGNVWVWGGNEYSQLGGGVTAKESPAVQVEGVSGMQKIAAGAYHSAAISNDGTLWIWGKHLDSVAERAKPFNTKYVRDAIDVSAGKFFTIVITGADIKK